MAVELTLRLASRPTWRVLSTATALLAVGHLAAMILTLGLGYDVNALRVLDLNEERSFGTIYSVALLVGTAMILAVLASATHRVGGRQAREARWWGALAALFLFMAADEAGEIHEVLIEPLRNALHTTGALYFAWVVPYTVFAVAIALLFTRFLLRLPREVALRFVIAGAVYVGGAVGMELVAGWMVASQGYGARSLPMELEYLIEETMEMLGAAYFLTAVLRYVERRGEPLRLSVAVPDGAPP